MKKFSIAAATAVLGCFLCCPVANAKITRVTVSKDAKIAKELGYTITLTANSENSGLAGTTTFEFRAPKNPLLQDLSAIVLRTNDGKKLTGRLPLEFQKGKSGEITCHFQLAPEIAKNSTLELVCPIPGMPNGTIYEVDLATYTQETSEGEQKSAAAFAKAVSGLPAIHPNVLEIRDGVRAFTDSHGDADAVGFLKKTATAPHEGTEQLAASIGLALLAEKHDTASFLKSWVVGKKELPSKVALLGISFLPTKDARAIAEAVVVDAEQHWQTRTLYLNLLRAIGDQNMLTKLEKLDREKIGPHHLAAIDGAVGFLKERLSLKDAAERDRWARQELLILQVSTGCPNFRFTSPALKWTAEQIHKCDKDISIGLLKAKLSVPPERAHGVALAAAIAGMQKNREVLPLLDKWAAANLNLISDPCREAASKIRSDSKLDPHGDPLPEHAVMRLGTVRWRPQNGAQCLGVSAGSRLIATGHHSNLVRIWDARTGRELNHWQSTPTSSGNAAVNVNCFAFSPKGEHVAVGNSAGIIEIRELSTGKEIRRFNRKGDSQITALVYSEDGLMLAAGNTDGGIDLWDVVGGKKLQSCAGHSGVVGCLTFTFDGKQLAAAGRQDPLIHLWDTGTGKEIIAFRGHENGVEQVAFTIDDKNLWSVSSDQTIRRWDVATGKEEHQIKANTKLIHGGVGPSNPVHPAAAFNRDQKVLASLSDEKKIRLWDTSTGREIYALPAESTGVSELAFSRDGTFIAAVGNDQSLRLWDAVTGKERGPIDGHRDWISGLVFSADGKQIVSSSWDRTARVWNAASGKELKQFVHPQPILDVALSSNGKLVTVGGFRDNTMKLWDIGAGRMLHEWKGEKNYFTSAVFSRDGDYLVAANGIDSVVLWNVASKERVRTFDGPGTRIALSRDGKLLAATGNNRDWYLWDFETGKQIYREHQLSGNFAPTGVAFSPDSKTLALGFQEGVSLRDATNGKKRAHLGDKPLHFVAFSPDGKLLATGSDTDKGPQLALWDVPSEKRICEWKGHVRGVRAIAFSPDGRRLASAGTDTTILIWNVESLVAK